MSLPSIYNKNAEGCPQGRTWTVKLVVTPSTIQSERLAKLNQDRELDPCRGSLMILRSHPVSNATKYVRKRMKITLVKKAFEQKSDLKESSFTLLGEKIVELPECIRHKHDVYQVVKHKMRRQISIQQIAERCERIDAEP